MPNKSIPNTPTYWATFYTVQALLLNEAPEKYSVPPSSYDDSLLNTLAHTTALKINNYYEKV